MMHSLRRAAIVLTLAGSSFVASAQTMSSTPTVEYGRTTIQLGPAFATFVQNSGAIITDLHNNPLQNSSFTLISVAGALDLTSGIGEVQNSGGLLVNAGGTLARIENFTLDTTNPRAAALTADIIINNHFVARVPLFSVGPPPGFSLPLPTTLGLLQESNYTLTLAPQASSIISSMFGADIPSGTTIGTASTYIVFAASN